MAESLWMMGKGYHYTYTTRAPDGVNFQNSKNKVYGPRLLVMVLGIHTYLLTRNQPEKCVWFCQLPSMMGYSQHSMYFPMTLPNYQKS